jgi:hypothetical protein
MLVARIRHFLQLVLDLTPKAGAAFRGLCLAV